MRVDLKTGDQSYAGTSKNVGVGGLFVVTDRQLRVGDHVTAELALPGHVLPMAVGAEVRWVEHRAAEGQSVRVWGFGSCVPPLG